MNGDGDDNYKEDMNGGKGDINKHIDIDGHLREHQHSQDHDENRLVFINPHLHHYGMCEGECLVITLFPYIVKYNLLRIFPQTSSTSLYYV